ncbi:hypothetical protein CcaverHIS631_0310560 [Cutaneotrichosporon cavernicola]|nr:hypothetical protein CcaverHIS631_0310560 [Cutaneotrichosporon cavernicola]BEJ06529.1 hypothetical protein CcaverHIS641_0310510 [Cutaneotrichosporon cavernicola]
MSTGRHIAPDRRSAFHSLRKMPSTLFRNNKPDDSLSQKNPRRRGALASFLGRKSPVEKTPQNKQRPSCGPDPFVRPEGVPSVRHHSPQPPFGSTSSPGPSRYRTTSIRSQTPDSMRVFHTVHIDDVDSLDDPLIDDDGTRLSVLEKAARVPLNSDKLPMRRTSLAFRPKTPQLTVLAETYGPEQPTVLPSFPTPEPEVPPKVQPRLKKEKARSRVWGVFSSKRISKSKAASQSPPSQRSWYDSVSQPSNRVTVSQPSNPTVQSSIRTPVAQAASRPSLANTMGRTSISKSSCPTTQFRPPTLHITHPSQDGDLSPSIPLRRFVNDPDSPFIARNKPAPSQPTSILVNRQGIETASRHLTSSATNRKSLPKRKSLAGLFGISLKRSIDRLRPASPAPAMCDPSTPSRMSIAANIRDDTSPDTLAFYSRQGTRSGFNGHGNLLHPDAHIHDVTSATNHLQDLVDSMDASFSLCKHRGEPGTPTPLRRARSGAFKPAARPTRPVSRSGRASAPPASPSKAFAHSISRVLDSHSRPTTPVKSPVKSIVQSFRDSISKSPARHSVISSHLPRPDSMASDMSETSVAASSYAPPSPSQGLDTSCNFKDSPSPQSMRSVEPDALTQPPSAFSFSHTRIGSRPPILDLDFGSQPSSMFSDMLGQFRSSKSSRGSGRSVNQSTRSSNRTTFDFAAEFAALTASRDSTQSVGDTLDIARSIEFSTDSPHAALAQLEEVLESRKNSVETLRGRERLSNPPFQGRIEFQMGVRARNISRPSPGPPPPFALPPTPEGPLDIDHRKQPSAISFASMSSLGAPLAHIDRGHVNYFEQVFATGTVPPPLPSLPSIGRRMNMSHHRRMSSEISVSSFMSAESSIFHTHGRESSSGSIVGRSDWASQRRASRDSEAMARLGSIARLGRPGLGERMFEGVDDSSIVDSGTVESETGYSIVASPTFGTRPYSFSSSTDETVDPCTEEDVSFFGQNHERNHSFVIMSRPMSRATLNESRVNDTFDFIDGPSKRGAVEVGIVDSYAGDNESASPALLTGGPVHSTPLERDIPLPRARHRPAALYLLDDGDETPGLLSPSDLTEVSSLFSLDTARGSNPPPGYPSHRREKGSITSIVQVHPTIREETSQKSLREPGGSDDPRSAWELVQELNARHWNDLGDVASSLLTESPVYSLYTSPEAPPVPHTRAEIEAILADSQATYKVLDNVFKSDKPVGLHRRKISLNDTRAAVAPYGVHPAPLETRFRSQRSTGQRVSPLLAEFARDVSPLPRILASAQPPPRQESKVSPPPHEARPRVTSSVRRDNLGWGRRRNSDEPAGNAPAVTTKAPASATLGSFPSFLAFSPSVPPQPTHKKAESAFSRPTYPHPLITAKAPPRRVQKRIHVKTDSKGSPMSVHSSSSRTCLAPRSESAPLSARPSNIPKPRRVHKIKSSPEIGRKRNRENGRAPAPSFVLAPPPSLRV